MSSDDVPSGDDENSALYLVAYQANGATGGIVPTDVNRYEQGAQVVVHGNSGGLERGGLLFSGWNTSSDGTGTSYAVGSILVMPAGNVTLYAQWILDVSTSYSVTYHKNEATSGTVPIDENSYAPGASVFVQANSGGLAHPDPNMVFTGWNRNPAGTAQAYAAFSTLVMPSENVVLYAQFRAPTHQVVYWPNGATGGSVPVDSNGYTEGQSVIVLGSSGMTRDGFAFRGWSTTSFDNYSTLYAEHDTFSMPAHLVYLYAQWWPDGKIVANDAATSDTFGYSIDVNGDYLIVGAPDDTNTANGFESGAAYVFRRDAMGNWDSGVKLVAPVGASGDDFGESVAIDGDYAVVGAPDVDGAGNSRGAVYIYRRTGTNSWDGGYTIVPFNTARNEGWGSSVAIDGTYVLIGTDKSYAYVYRRVGTNTWQYSASFPRLSNRSWDALGRSVAIDGEYAIIGDHDGDDAAANAGVAVIYRRTGLDTWDGGWRLLPAGLAAGDHFGVSVAIDGDYVIVGAFGESDHLLGPDVGAAYVFQRTAHAGSNSWDSGTRIQAPAADRGRNHRFGNNVAIGGGYALVGSHLEDNTYGSSAGAAYAFRSVGSAWTLDAKITAADANGAESFGASVALQDDMAFIAADQEDRHEGFDQGAVYAFRRLAPGNWIGTY